MVRLKPHALITVTLMRSVKQLLLLLMVSADCILARTIRFRQVIQNLVTKPYLEMAKATEDVKPSLVMENLAKIGAIKHRTVILNLHLMVATTNAEILMVRLRFGATQQIQIQDGNGATQSHTINTGACTNRKAHAISKNTMTAMQESHNPVAQLPPITKGTLILVGNRTRNAQPPTPSWFRTATVLQTVLLSAQVLLTACTLSGIQLLQTSAFLKTAVK